MLKSGKSFLMMAIAAVAAGSFAPSAQANTITLDFQANNNTADPLVNAFTYLVKLSSGSSLATTPPTGVTAYDVGGFVSASFLPSTVATFTLSTASTGGFGVSSTTPGTPGVIFDTAATNVTLTYLDNGGTGPFGGSTTLGTLTIFSNLKFTSLTRALSVGSTDIAPDDAGLQNSNSSSFAPALAGTPAAPLPGAVAGGVALLGMLGVGRLRRSTVTI